MECFPHSIWVYLMDHYNQTCVPKNGRCLHNPVHRIYLQRHNLNFLKIQRIETLAHLDLRDRSIKYMRELANIQRVHNQEPLSALEKASIICFHPEIDYG
jgi:hypothetical protein